MNNIILAKYLEIVSNSDDPSYTPEMEITSKRKSTAMPDHFNIKHHKKSKTLGTASSSSPASTLSLSSKEFVPISSCSSLVGVGDVGLQSYSSSNVPYLDGKFFKVVEVKEREKKIVGECQLCLPKTVNIKGVIGVSTNFLKHLKRVHSSINALEEYNNYKKEKKKPSYEERKGNIIRATKTSKQQKVTDAFTKNGAFVDQNTFDKRIVNFIVKTTSAISIIDNPAFIELFEGLEINIMSKNAVIKRIEEQFTQTMSEIKKDIEKIQYVCTTVDIWSTKRRSFLGITCHWINPDNYKRCSVALACKRFRGTHSYDKIAEMIEDIHAKFDLGRERLIATVSDNGTNFVKALKEFTSVDTDTYEDSDWNEEDEDESEFLNLSENNIVLPKHVRCASHILNLIAITDVKNAIQSHVSLRTRHTNTMTKCNELWKLANKPKTNEIMQETLEHALSYPGSARWNSLYESISRILQEKDNLPKLYKKLNDLHIQHYILRDYELDYLKEYCLILKPLANALDILESEQNTYFGFLLPCLGSLNKKFNRLKNEKLSTYTEPILDACSQGLKRRFGKYFDLSSKECKEATIASFTIPQFKLRWVNSFEEFNMTDLNNNITKLILEAAQDIHFNQDYESKSDIKPKVDDFFELDDESISKDLTATNTFKRNVELETLQYLNDTSVDLSVLQNYPVLKQLFLKFNTCLPSSASVERLFSFTEIINTPRRRDLSDEHLEQLVLLKANGYQQE